jgi:hypothetical protein
MDACFFTYSAGTIANTTVEHELSNMHAEGGCTSIRRIGGGDRGVISSFFGGRTYFIKSWQFNFFAQTPYFR